MRITEKGGGNFETAPEFTGPAVCCDVTPLEKRTSQKYGEQEQFKVVFEIGALRKDGQPFAVWSKPFTPSLNEKSNFRKFLKGWLGRDLTAEELKDGFDTETLIGRPAFLVVVHEESSGETYANIAAITPHKAGEPLKLSGKFVRKQDRKKGAEGDSTYRRTEAPAEPEPEDFGKTKVHVGQFAGTELRDLPADRVAKLITHWLPTAEKAEKPTADDKRLIAALKAFQKKQDDEVPY